ncbi:epimerase [Actinocrispum sp. NPDC049592]|uniref:epimerase n=1 Tax=Actinocrispum sp. NPDC049592 TaxID=3154835 RepID=UPI00342A4EDD
MKVIVFGASGMVGYGVLRECLVDPEVTQVLAVGRRPLGREHEKLTEAVVPDLTDLSTVDFTGYDACFFCLGVSSAGMSEADYRHITYDFTLAAGRKLAEVNPDATFTYVSGMGTDPNGRQMWSRVKGRTENDLLALPLHAYMFRPGYIQPMYGATSRTTLYRVLYKVLVPLYPLVKRIAPGAVTTTEQIGLAMLRVAKNGSPQKILDPRAINAL